MCKDLLPGANNAITGRTPAQPVIIEDDNPDDTDIIFLGSAPPRSNTAVASILASSRGRVTKAPTTRRPPVGPRISGLYFNSEIGRLHMNSPRVFESAVDSSTSSSALVRRSRKFPSVLSGTASSSTAVSSRSSALFSASSSSACRPSGSSCTLVHQVYLLFAPQLLVRLVLLWIPPVRIEVRQG